MSFEKKVAKLVKEDKKYARDMIETASLYEGGLGLYGKTAKKLLQTAPKSAGFTHLDAGCGSGELLLSLERQLRKRRETYFNLIGVDTNPFLLEEAAIKARKIGGGLRVIEHRSSEYTENEDGKVIRLFLSDPQKINQIKTDSKPQIILVQDDLMSPQVLPDILSRLGLSQGLTSMSFTLAGVSQSMALEAISEKEGNIDEETLLKVIVAIAKLTRVSLYDLAAQNLMPGGALIDTVRENIKMGEAEHTKEMKREFPRYIGNNSPYLHLEQVEFLGEVDEIERRSPLALKNLHDSSVPKEGIQLVQSLIRRNANPFVRK